MLIARRVMLIGAAGLVALSAGIVVLRSSGPEPGFADPDDPEQVARGEVVYAGQCASCHGERLEGQPNWRVRKPDGRLPAPPHDEAGHTWHHPDEQLFRIIKHGVKPPLVPEGYESDMTGFADILSNDDTWAVLAFIKNAWPPKERAFQERVDQAYRD